jgi:predicted amidophosphoribosyltransferase
MRGALLHQQLHRRTLARVLGQGYPMRKAWFGPWIVVSDAADLVLGRCCRVCEARGAELCGTCLADLRLGPHVRTNLPGNRLALSATSYAGVGRAVVLAYKEDGHRSLAAPLGLLLADAVAAILPDLGHRRTTLIPVPGHSHPRRGFDALGGIIRHARAELGRSGIEVDVVRMLRMRRDYPVAKALSREERLRHLSGAFTVSHPYADRCLVSGPLILVDDVITSGATVTEALRALRSAGWAVQGVAAVAATA